MLGVLAGGGPVDPQRLQLAAHVVAGLAQFLDAGFQAADRVAVGVELLLLFEHRLLGAGLLLQCGLQFLLGVFHRLVELAEALAEGLVLVLPDGELLFGVGDLATHAGCFLALGLQALLQQLQPPAPAGPLGAQGLAAFLGRLYLGLHFIEALGLLLVGLLQLGYAPCQALPHVVELGALALQLVALADDALKFLVDLLAPRLGVLAPRLGDGALAAQLGGPVLEAADLARQARALLHQPLQGGAGLPEARLGARNLVLDLVQLALAGQHARRGLFALHPQRAALAPQAVAGEKRDAGMLRRQTQRVVGVLHQVGRRQRRTEILRQVERGRQAGDDGGIVDAGVDGGAGTECAKKDARGVDFGKGASRLQRIGVRIEEDCVGQLAQKMVDAVFPALPRLHLVGQEAGLVDADLGQRLDQASPALLVLLRQLGQDAAALLEIRQAGFQIAPLVRQLGLAAEQGVEVGLLGDERLGRLAQRLLETADLLLHCLQGDVGLLQLAFQPLRLAGQEVEAEVGALQLHGLALQLGARLVELGNRLHQLLAQRLQTLFGLLHVFVGGGDRAVVVSHQSGRLVALGEHFAGALVEIAEGFLVFVGLAAPFVRQASSRLQALLHLLRALAGAADELLASFDYRRQLGELLVALTQLGRQLVEGLAGRRQLRLGLRQVGA